MPGGGDWEIVDDEKSTAYLDTRYNLKTHDGAVIYLQTRGVRKGPKEILDKLGDDTSIQADQYSYVWEMRRETDGQNALELLHGDWG